MPTREAVGRVLTLLSGVALLTAIGGGCGLFGGSADDKPRVADTLTTRPTLSDTTYSSDRPLPRALQPVNRPVDQGQLPLVYLIEGSGPHRVVNVASGEEIANFDAKAGQIVRVETRGVLVENKSILGAQLMPGVYAIERVEPGTGTLTATQTHTMPTMPRPAPSTRPAGTAQPPAGAKPQPPAPATSPPPRTSD